jgi:hypothetical protein
VKEVEDNTAGLRKIDVGKQGGGRAEEERETEREVGLRSPGVERNMVNSI